MNLKKRKRKNISICLFISVRLNPKETILIMLIHLRAQSAIHMEIHKKEEKQS